jgi:hypothetical protein
VLTISNPTAAAPDQILGYGCGLTIIQRICEKLGWQIETHLVDGVFSARLVMIPAPPGRHSPSSPALLPAVQHSGEGRQFPASPLPSSPPAR